MGHHPVARVEVTQGQAIAVALTFVALTVLGVMTSVLVASLQRGPSRSDRSGRGGSLRTTGSTTRTRRQPRAQEVVLAGQRLADAGVRDREALLLGSLEAADAGQPVDDLTYSGKSAAWGDRVGIIGEIDVLLGAQARTVAAGLVTLEEALAQRRQVGPDLWRHQLQHLGERTGLSLIDRTRLAEAADAIEAAEARLVERGLLEAGERVPTVAALHWAHGVHLVRIAVHQNVLSPADARRWFDRAGELVTESFGESTGTVLAALILPGMIVRDHEHTERALRFAATIAPHFEVTGSGSSEQL